MIPSQYCKVCGEKLISSFSDYVVYAYGDCVCGKHKVEFWEFSKIEKIIVGYYELKFDFALNKTTIYYPSNSSSWRLGTLKINNTDLFNEDFTQTNLPNIESKIKMLLTFS